MWEKTLIESKGLHQSRGKWWTIPAAAAIHGVLILLLILSAYWHLEAIEAPPQRLEWSVAIPVVLPPMRLGGGASESAKNNVSKQEVSKPVVTQPVETPELIEQPASSTSAELTDLNVTGSDPFAPPGPGSPDGVAGGFDDGGPANSGMIGQQSEEPRVVSVGMQAPVLIHKVEPEYPALAMKARIQGIVILEAVITKTGTVEQVKSLRADHVLLERAAVDAVLKWKYQPATLQGKPVKVYFSVTVTFRLK